MSLVTENLDGARGVHNDDIYRQFNTDLSGLRRDGLQNQFRGSVQAKHIAKTAAKNGLNCSDFSLLMLFLGGCFI